MEAFNLRFVREVKKYPELYDFTLQTYSKRDATEKAWTNVSKVVKLPIGDCKEKWRNLRSVYVKNLKPKPSRGTPKKRPYYLMEAMQFVCPFVKGGSSYSMGNSPASQTSASQPTQDIHDNEVDNQEEVYPDCKEEMLEEISITSALVSPTPSSYQGDRVGTPSSEVSSVAREQRIGKGVHNSEPDEALSTYFAAKQAEMFNTPSKQDERDRREKGIKHFLMSLVPDLLQLNDVQLRSYKRKTLLLIDEVVSSDSAHFHANHNEFLQSSSMFNQPQHQPPP